MQGPDLTGEVVENRYRIVERIAEGAMGVVYRANRLKLDRAVAIKVMHASLPDAMDGRKRFEREAKLMAKLEHPHCVSIIDYGLHGTKPYVVMELVRGRSLYDAIVEGRFEIPRAVDVLRQLLSGLAHAHEQGIVHRDIKPANIMITPKAPLGVHVRILDFGLARMLEKGTSLSYGVAVGTPSYMAPEQCRGEQVDARADIYACGVVLFEMLTGTKPFVAGDPIGIIKKHIQQAPPRLADVVPGDYGALEDVVARALAKSPVDRYPSAVAMAEALEAALSNRVALDPTAVLAPVQGSAAEPTADVPITVGSSVVDAPSKRNVDSSLRRMLPASRTRYVIVLGGLLVVGGAIAGTLLLQQPDVASESLSDARVTEVTTTPPAPASQPSPEDELAADAVKLARAGKSEAAIDLLVKARRLYPDHALLAVTLGKLYFAKMWWNDGMVNLRDALRLDPQLREDPELLQIALRAFLRTPSYDARLGRFIVELGPPMIPLLEETARDHSKPNIRARASAVLRKLR